MSDDNPAAAAAPRPRLAILDGIRGYLLLAMFVAHLCVELADLRHFSWMNYVRHSRHLPIGDVEFFVALSGFVAALSYGRAYDRGGIAGAGRAVLRRLRWLYSYQVGATVILILLVRWAGLPGVDLREGVHHVATPTLLLQAFTLAAMPENLDVLMLYIVLMPAMPFVLALLAAGRTRLLFALLLLAWLVAALGLDRALSQWVVAHLFDWTAWFGLMGHFDPLSYAILFYGGFALGHGWRRDGPGFVARLVPPHPLAVAAALAAVAGYALVMHSGWRPLIMTYGKTGLFTVHAAAATVGVGCLGYWLLTAPALPAPLAWLARAARAFFGLPLLVFLGRNSLFVYAAHVVVVALLKGVAMAIEPVAARQAVMVALAVAGIAALAALTAAKRRWLPAAA